ncbi:MAG: recombination mediator RecR [Cyclobacteriaceae bacterium]|nr:recombination mediator RecR [Cyclobacteriaceae bacterium]
MLQEGSNYLQQTVDEISKLPGIGRKTALRLALHLLKQDKNQVKKLTSSIESLIEHTKKCKKCFNITEAEYCHICNSTKRDHSTICVVQDFPDLMAIENTSQYKGVYHVLGGLISPLEGIGPEDLTITDLHHRVKDASSPIGEIILALSPSMEGDTTGFYISKKLADFNLKITTLARGIPMSGELEYADELSLSRSLAYRTKYESEN